MPNIHLLKYNETSFLFFFAQYYYYMYSYTTALMWLLNQAHKNQSSVSRNFYSFLKNLDKRSKSRWILWRNCKMWNVRWYYITHIASYNPTTWKYMHVLYTYIRIICLIWKKLDLYLAWFFVLYLKICNMKSWNGLC